MNNYPPGVTGNEYEIVGPDYEKEIDTPCPECSGQLVEQSYRKECWVVCCACPYQLTLEPLSRELP